MRDQDLMQLTEDIKKDWQETLGYKRFNRHEVFEPGDSSHILNMIGDCNGLHSLKNMLYGLFDGYWYEELIPDLKEKSNVNSNDIVELESILSRVDKHLATVLTAE